MDSVKDEFFATLRKIKEEAEAKAKANPSLQAQVRELELEIAHLKGVIEGLKARSGYYWGSPYITSGSLPGTTYTSTPTISSTAKWGDFPG